MRVLVIATFFVSFMGLNKVYSRVTDYYWRDLSGPLSSYTDQILVGEDAGGSIYIGQASCPNEGILYARIETRNSFQSPCAERAQSYASKILCSDNPQNFRWLATSSATYSGDLNGKDAIKGGYFLSNSGVAHVGKYISESGYMIGSVNYAGSPPMLTYIDPSTWEVANVTSQFEVLIYETN